MERRSTQLAQHFHLDIIIDMAHFADQSRRGKLKSVRERGIYPYYIESELASHEDLRPEIY
jgi:hypothetical protein